MSNKSDFKKIWKKTVSQTKVDIDHNAAMGKLDGAYIKNSYLANAKKWETDIYQEGEWLEKFRDTEFMSEFLQEVNDIEFVSDTAFSSAKRWGFLLSFIGVVLIFIMPLIFSVSWILSIIVGIIIVVFGVYLQGVLNKKALNDYNQKAKNDFIRIVENKGKTLEALIEKHNL